MDTQHSAAHQALPDEKAVQALLTARLWHRAMQTHRTSLSYAYATLRSASLYRHFQSVLSYVRRFRLITLCLRAVTLLLTILETGALVVFSTVLLLILLPLGTALMLGILLTAAIESKRKNHQMSAVTDQKRVYVLFLEDADNPFLASNARALAADPHAVVLVVSPYWISARGLTKGPFYCTVRAEFPRVYLVRRYYFLHLNRHILAHRKTAYLY